MILADLVKFLAPWCEAAHRLLSVIVEPPALQGLLKAINDAREKMMQTVKIQKTNGAIKKIFLKSQGNFPLLSQLTQVLIYAKY